MKLRPIRTKREYQAALKEAEALWDSRSRSKRLIRSIFCCTSWMRAV